MWRFTCRVLAYSQLNGNLLEINQEPRQSQLLFQAGKCWILHSVITKKYLKGEKLNK